MKPIFSALAAVLLIALPACESFSGLAPKGTPRVEVELAVLADEAFLAQLVDPGPELLAAVKEAVRDKADIGLRFYPTLSERYGAKDLRPPYLMTVELQSLNIIFEQELIEPEGAPARLVTTVDDVACSITVALERRRGNAPPLTIAKANSTREVGAEQDPERIEAEHGYVPMHDGPTLKVLERDIVEAVQAATNQALRSMRTPIDREFAPKDDGTDG